MKKLIILLGGIFYIQTVLFAQQPVYKYGKVSAGEIEMLRYDADTAAAAAVLCEEGLFGIDYSNRTGFVGKLNVWRRVKILKEEGKQYADVEVPYYASSQWREKVVDIEAYVYNIENGTISKTRMDRSCVADEQGARSRHRIKFSIPNVKKGSVIEYKYTIVSDLYWMVPTWYFQSDIPVQRSVFEVDLYEYFSFNELMQGYEFIAREEKEVPKTIWLEEGARRGGLNCYQKQIVYTGTRLPAVKGESYVWNIAQYCCAVDLEIRTMQLPQSMLKDFGSSWQSVDKKLLEDSDFGRKLIASNPYSDAVGKIIATGMDDLNKVRAICNHIKREVAWNGSYDLYATNPRESAKKKMGSNADINFLVLAALREAGFVTDIILVRSRTRGVVRLERPSIHSFDSFIIQVNLPDGTRAYFDGSASQADVNILSSRFLVEQGKVFDKGNMWVDLRHLGSNRYVHNVQFTVDSAGMASGRYVTTATSQCAHSMKIRKYSFDTEDEYISDMEKKTGAEIEEIQLNNGIDTLSPNCSRIIRFKKQFASAGEFIYIHPFIETYDDESALNAPERKYPIEFSYPEKLVYTASIVIPDGYTVAELPKSAGMHMEEVGAKCIFSTGIKGNVVMLRLVADLDSEIIPASSYADFRMYWQKMCELYKSVIVLKKADAPEQSI